MTQYINKSALVAEIEKLKAYLQIPNAQLEAIKVCDNVISVIDHLKVKEVDIKKELSYEDYIRFFDEHPNFPDDWGFDEAWVFAKYFFELGIKAQKGK